MSFKEVPRKIFRQLVAIFFIIIFPVLMLFDCFKYVGFNSLAWYWESFKCLCRVAIWKNPKSGSGKE
jgi:hypothetical protein